MLEQDSGDALEADRETDRGYLLAEEFADEVVVSAAAAECSTEFGRADFEHRTGVVALTAYQRRVVYNLITVGKRIRDVDNPAQICDIVLLTAERGGTVERQLIVRKLIHQPLGVF